MRKFLIFFCALLIPYPVYAADGLKLSASQGLSYGTVNLTVENPSNINISKLSYKAVGCNATGGNADGQSGAHIVTGRFAVNKEATHSVYPLTGLIGGVLYDISVSYNDDMTNEILPHVIREVQAQPFGESSLDGKNLTVNTEEQLANIRKMNMYDGGYTFVLGSDINLSGEWLPIGDGDRAFENNFNGGGHTIKNLKISGNDNAGLFGKIKNARVTNLNFDGVYSQGKKFAGVLAGEAVNCLLRKINVKNAGVVTFGPQCVAAGGLAGIVSGDRLAENFKHMMRINDCSVSAYIISESGRGGGIAGEASYSFIENSKSSGKVEAFDGAAGGFSGRLTDRSRVSDCSSSSDVKTREGSAGGFVGEIVNESCVEFSFASGSVSSSKAAGGFVGTISGKGFPNTLTKCFSASPWVTGGDKTVTHRFAGELLHNGVNDCYASLGAMVAVGGELVPVVSGSFGADGADVSRAELPNMLKILTGR